MFVEEKIKKARLEICLSCEKIIKITHQCKECMCFMDLKTRLEGVKCPLGKWEQPLALIIGIIDQGE